MADPVYDPYRTEIHEAPHPVYEEMRGECPVYHNDEFDFWALFDYADVSNGLRDWSTYTNSEGTFLKHEYEAMKEFIPKPGKFQDHDPPRCRELRNVVKEPFQVRAIRAMEPQIRKLVTDMLDEFDHQTHADFAADFAEPFPVRVITDMLGLPRSHEAQMSEWSHAMFERDDDGNATPRAYESGRTLRDFLNGILSDRAENPKEDLMTAIAQGTIDGVPLTEDEMIGIAMFLYVAGNETTTALIGNALLLLAEQPDMRQKLIDDPSLIPNAIEEFLRMDAPVPQQGRTTTREVEINGRTIPEGETVLMVYASANRDPNVFENPDEFDPTRENASKHLSFGEGVHHCLGAHLARLEAKVALEELLGRYPNYRISGDVAWYMASALRGPVNLPVELRP